MLNRLTPIFLAFMLPSLADCTPPPSQLGAPTAINDAYRDPDLEVAGWTDRFEGESREVYRARLDVVAALGLQPGMTVADIGSGTGLFVAYFSKAVGPKGRVLAVDIVPKFVAHIDARAKAAGLTNVSARLGEQADVKLEAGSVDLMFVCDTYHHFEDVNAILASIKRALKPGGRLIVVDYHKKKGVSRPFIFKHVRAPMETFAAEIRAAGFEPLPAPETPFLVENYLIVFKKR